MKITQILLLFCTFLLLGTRTYAAPTCPASVLATAKNQRLFLYFPTADDATYPEHGTFGVTTSPLHAFDVANLDTSIGTTAQLRDRMFDFVTDDYCEFSVKVESFTTMPPQTDPRWQIVGIGSDGNGSGLFGEAQAVDTNDADSQDFARVWSNAFGEEFGNAGGALNGANSTLERWATAIGHTVAHEAAHNYGAAHGHSAPRPASSEDEQNNHIMATGSTGLTGEIRASRNRHFSDTEYEILGHNIGLTAKTLHNWDFINPNNTSANGMRIKILTTANSLTIGWWYNGSSSPWQNPTITNTGTTQSFQGTTYNVFNLDFTSAKSWNGPAPGIVEAGSEFHTGASFTGSDTVIVTKVELYNGTITNPSNKLALSPRLPGYDAGTADFASGDFAINFFNTDLAAGELILTNVQVHRLPRMLDINAMLSNADPVDIRGLPLTLNSAMRGAFFVEKKLNLRDRIKLPVGKLTDKRSVDILYGANDCLPGSIGSGTKPINKRSADKVSADGVGDSNRGEVSYCAKGNALSLFPATYTYIIATVVQPNAKYWDKAQNKFINGPLASRLFYQVGGIVPDFNKNGVDDLIDIRTSVSPDVDNNGVPDEAQNPSISMKDPSTPGFLQWLLLLLVLILLLLILLWPRH